jgi:hypothetical protein
MEVIQRPLKLSEKENREMLAASEKRRAEVGSHHGNRHERRLAARTDRRARRRQPETAGA